MENRLFLRAAVLLLGMTIQSFSVFAQQSATIGEVRNALGIITNSTEAEKVLKGGLSVGAKVSDLRIEWIGDAENKYYLIGSISGDPVSAKAIQLEQKGIQLRAVGGPGVEITCTGVNCSRCDLNMRKFKFYCVCEESTLSEEGYCNMTSKFIVTPW